MSERRRVAFFCHPYHRGGVTRWMADAAIACANDGMEVYFVTVEPVKEFFSAKGRETLLQLLEKGSGDVQIIKAHAGSEFELGTPQYRSYIYRQLLVQLPQGTPVIVSDDPVVWESAVALYRSYPIIGVLHADEPHYYDLAKKYAGQADVLACVSARVTKTVKEQVPDFDKDHIHTIPCGINLPSANPASHTGDILQLVYLGRISDYQKRTGDLVKIAALLAKENVAFHMNIIGNGETKPALENKFREAGLQAHVTFWGWLSQKEVADRLAESDILVLTSDFEGTPIAMMEALAAGCGIVGTRVSGIEDLEYYPVAADCAGIFAVGDIEDAISKIKKVADIPKPIRQEAARKIAETEFSMKVCLNRYLQAMDAMEPRVMEAPPVISLPMTDLLYSKAIATARALKLTVTKG